MGAKLRIEGSGDIERALVQLTRGQSKASGRRALKKVLKPVAQAAEGMAGGKFKVAVTSKLDKSQKRRARGDQSRNRVAMYVGPADGSHSPHAHLYEDGTAPRYHKETGKFTGEMPANPFLRPAWDLYAPKMLEALGLEIRKDIEKTLERARSKALRAGK
jgi:HK97 gp10 family phage protein